MEPVQIAGGPLIICAAIALVCPKLWGLPIWFVLLCGVICSGTGFWFMTNPDLYSLLLVIFVYSIIGCSAMQAPQPNILVTALPHLGILGAIYVVKDIIELDIKFFIFAFGAYLAGGGFRCTLVKPNSSRRKD